MIQGEEETDKKRSPISRRANTGAGSGGMNCLTSTKAIEETYFLLTRVEKIWTVFLHLKFHWRFLKLRSIDLAEFNL